MSPRKWLDDTTLEVEARRSCSDDLDIRIGIMEDLQCTADIFHDLRFIEYDEVGVSEHHHDAREITGSENFAYLGLFALEVASLRVFLEK